jgi:ribonucleoside-diphosphate reductase alpha chain
MTRRALPDRRESTTLGVLIAGKEVFLTWSCHADGSLGEIFLVVGVGSVRDWANDWAMAFSLAIQHGTPLATLVDLYIHSDSHPRGQVVGHPTITECTSIVNFVVRALALEFLTAPAPPKVAGEHEARSGI